MSYLMYRLRRYAFRSALLLALFFVAQAYNRSVCTAYKRASGLLPPEDPAGARAWHEEYDKQRKLAERQNFVDAYERRAARLLPP